MKHIILLIVALLCMVGSNAQTRKPQMRKMGQTSQTVKGKTTSMGKNNRGARNKKSVDSNTLFWQRLIENAAKNSERERYEMTDRGRVMKNVKEKFSAWNEIREFEKTTAYELRLQQSSKFVFDSICYDAIVDRIGHNWSLDLEKYNADKEYFPITCNFNEIRATIYVSVPIAEAPQFQEDFNEYGGFQTAEPLRRFGKFVYVQNMICPTSILVNRKPYWIWRGGNREGYYGEINDDFFIDADTAKVKYKDAKPLVVKFNDLGIKNKYLTNYVYVFKKGDNDIYSKKEQNESESNKIFNGDDVDQKPSFPGGTKALNTFLASNLKYPVAAVENGIQGRVIVKFIVEKDGSISNVEVDRSVYPSLDNEAMRVVKAMPKWIPGQINGKAVKVKWSFPFTFRLIENTKNK